MEGKRIKVFGVIMSLLLVFSFAATFSLSSTSVVSAGTQKWTQITIPGTDDMQLAPGTDVGAMAVSPDGGTLFVAVYVTTNASLPTLMTGYWYVFKSVDDGYTWKNTGYSNSADVDPTEQIVAIKTSPDWMDDGVVVVATTDDAYYSANRGTAFESMVFNGTGTITSMDVSLDNDGDPTYVLGTTTDVWLLSGFSGWEEQYVGDGFAVNVLAVAFSPEYGEDGTIFAIITDGTTTKIRAESDISVNNWGSYIQDGVFDNPDLGPIVASTASIAFPEDYNSQPSVFVGLEALDFATGAIEAGDAFRVDLVMGTIATSNVEDLDIRGENTETDVNSIAVSGASSSAFIIVGLTALNNEGPMSEWKAQAHYSQNGGESWLQCYKPPSGMWFVFCGPIVVMAPDFEDSEKAYCSNGYINRPSLGGYQPTSFSGLYVSITQGTTWNGRGLLDHDIDEIEDVVPSPRYDTDSTLFMVTRDDVVDLPLGINDFGLLWETKDGGSKWDLILGMTLQIPLPGVAIDKIEIPAYYPDEPSMFVTGPQKPIAPYDDTNIIARTTDEGNLWASTLRAPSDGDNNPLPVDAWKVIDNKTLIVANSDKVWKTTDMGAHWIQEDGNNITGNVIDLQLWNDTTVIVGTDAGDVFICQNWETDFSFTQVGDSPGVAGDEVRLAFDTNYDDNGMIYAGVNGSAATQGVWRIDANGGDDWEQIYDAEDILSIACDGNGILWAVADGGVAFWPAALPLYQTAAIRQVNPTAPIDDILPGGESPFEYAVNGLTSNLWLDLETAPTQTYVFAIGGAGNTELWAYIDTLIKPTLISPADGATAAGTILQGNAMALLSLRWEEMPKATTYEYQVAYDTGFGSIAVEDDTVEGTQATIQLFLGEQYYWRVRAVEPIVSQWSDVWTFTTPLGPASSKPIVTYPGAEDSHNDIPLTPTLTWTSTVECTGYELMVAKNCDWSSPIVNLTGSSALGTDTCYSITQALHQGTNYCWKVRAINEDTGTASPWSDTGTFTTLVIEEEEEEGTPVWVWVVIALSAVLLVGVVVLIIRTRRPV
ncbi:MAG: hypothetical protein WC562_08345 [Dehalococcoidia bacterium]